jgi:hypothetical protein
LTLSLAALALVLLVVLVFVLTRKKGEETAPGAGTTIDTKPAAGEPFANTPGAIKTETPAGTPPGDAGK